MFKIYGFGLIVHLINFIVKICQIFGFLCKKKSKFGFLSKKNCPTYDSLMSS